MENTTNNTTPNPATRNEAAEETGYKINAYGWGTLTAEQQNQLTGRNWFALGHDDAQAAERADVFRRFLRLSADGQTDIYAALSDAEARDKEGANGFERHIQKGVQHLQTYLRNVVAEEGEELDDALALLGLSRADHLQLIEAWAIICATDTAAHTRAQFSTE